jgi:hypothetical protein
MARDFSITRGLDIIVMLYEPFGHLKAKVTKPWLN